MNKPAVLLATTLFCLSACGANSQIPVSEYVLQVSDRVTLAGLLNEAAIDDLSAQGALVIDLRTAEEGIDVEQQKLSDAKVTYAHLPMGRKPLPVATVAALNVLLTDHSDQDVVIHCASGNRAGLLWAAHLLDAGTPLEDALATVADIATKTSTTDAIRAYAKKRAQ
jgi:protein tyrosine phosphatase (PTP) superfamily phosphohydrolase (DUF442 family)